MFNYKKFRKEMKNRGHKVHKRGGKIVIEPNNNYIGYAQGFLYVTDVISGFEEHLSFITMDHFNNWIYSIEFRILGLRS